MVESATGLAITPGILIISKAKAKFSSTSHPGSILIGRDS